MGLGRTIGALVLATGVVCGTSGAARGQFTPEEPPEYKGVARKPTTLPVNPWKAVAPQPEHAILAGLVGHFKTDAHVTKTQLVRAKDTVGVADGKSLMGGLFVQVTHSEPRNKEPYEGMLVIGFDAGTGKYTADSINQATTAITRYVGSYDSEKKTLSLTSRYNDPKSKVLTTARMVIAFVDEKSWSFEEFIARGLGAKENKTLTMEFKRQESSAAGEGATPTPAIPPVSKSD